MGKISRTKGSRPVKLALAAVAACASIGLAVQQYTDTESTSFLGRLVQSAFGIKYVPRRPKTIETDDGRYLLWARGPRDIETGEWFDVTGSPLDPRGYQFGIGKDLIPAIDQPEFVSIQDHEKLREHGFDDESSVIGYFHNGQAKAYPIWLMDDHEIVNDVVGGKPVTVAW